MPMPPGKAGIPTKPKLENVFLDDVLSGWGFSSTAKHNACNLKEKQKETLSDSVYPDVLKVEPSRET